MKFCEDPYAYHASGMFRYGINTVGDLVIEDFLGRQMFVANYVGGPGAPFNMAGIYIFEFDMVAVRIFEDLPAGYSVLNTWQFALGDFMKANFGVSYWNEVDPLALDLDGDGLELIAQTSVSPLFDIDGDGYLERTGWVRGDDGLLAIDANQNGIVDGVAELFGGNGQSGFAALAAHDSNSDGIIDASDAAFADLRVWRDLDGDAVSDAGELETLAEAGIVSISLTATPLTEACILADYARRGRTFPQLFGKLSPFCN